ncbi:MAG: hypothetical protein JO360_08315 [Acidobacteria bacterium]|nr:hypothetical protein [Acidobacteriota bacterium]
MRMPCAKTRGMLIRMLVLLAVLGLFALPAFAQCPLCRLSVESSEQGKMMAKGLNLGILVLLVPPVTVFCSIFAYAFKHRRARGD